MTTDQRDGQGLFDGIHQLHDVHPHLETALLHGVTASADWIFQSRESLRDGVYSVPGFLIIPAGKSNARFVGHRPGTEVRWQANRQVLVTCYGLT